MIIMRILVCQGICVTKAFLSTNFTQIKNIRRRMHRFSKVAGSLSKSPIFGAHRISNAWPCFTASLCALFVLAVLTAAVHKGRVPKEANNAIYLLPWSDVSKLSYLLTFSPGSLEQEDLKSSPLHTKPFSSGVVKHSSKFYFSTMQQRNLFEVGSDGKIVAGEGIRRVWIDIGSAADSFSGYCGVCTRSCLPIVQIKI